MYEILIGLTYIQQSRYALLFIHLYVYKIIVLRTKKNYRRPSRRKLKAHPPHKYMQIPPPPNNT